MSGAAYVDLVDANILAAANKNILSLDIPNANVIASDALNAVIDKKYELVLTNPPFHTGKNINYSMANVFIDQGQQVLTENGLLFLVANKFIRYDRIMKEFFQEVSVIVETNRYHLLLGKNKRN